MGKIRGDVLEYQAAVPCIEGCGRVFATAGGNAGRCIGSAVPQLEHILVERDRLRSSRHQVRDGSVLKIRRGNSHLSCRGYDDPQSFVVPEKEGLVFDDRSTNRSCPLIHIVEWPL